MDDETCSVRILYGHFKRTQLSTANTVKICSVGVLRQRLEIDIEAMNDVMISHQIDGRMDNKSTPNGNGQHIRRLHDVVGKWKFIKMEDTKKTVDREEEAIDDGKEDEEEPVDDEQEVLDQMEPEQPPAVHEIGKQFSFWDSVEGHPRFVEAKYENMKEEVMDSPLLDGLVSIGAWTKLTKDIEAILGTVSAPRITSNGHSFKRYGIQQYEPFNAEHLRALKLYTDFAPFYDAEFLIKSQRVPI